MQNYAANAILTKSRAKYGKRLTVQNYKDMILLDSVADVASYLKTRTHYADALKNMNESLVHRGNLEFMLKAKLYEDFVHLCRFERAVGEHINEYVLLRGDISQTLAFFRLYLAGRPQDLILSLPEYFKHRRGIDFVALSRCRDYGEILKIFEKSPLYQVLSSFRPSGEKPIDYTMLEVMLEKYIYDKMFEITEKHSSGDSRRELNELFGLSAEIENIMRIYREKKYYNVSKAILRVQMIPHKRYLNTKQLNSLIEAEKAEDVISLLKETVYGRFFRDIKYTTMDDLMQGIRFKSIQRKMRVSSNPAVVMYCCIVLFDMEIEDITSIIEGVRYQLPSDDIKKLLVLEI